ncbi:MAG: transcription elongation factor GreA [Chloroflexota bacterium]|nr:MAG: transcription elongation factor GreA [Chloroflexota bacterium]
MTDVEEKVLVTEEGWERLREELLGLLQERRSRIEEQTSLGRDAESDVLDPQSEIATLERRISQLETVLSQAEPVRRAKIEPGVVNVGSHVIVQWEDDQMPETYMVVGPPEVSVQTGRISYESPVGRALMGRRVGDEIEVSTPGGMRRLNVIAVS